jgi:hypothetical protein
MPFGLTGSSLAACIRRGRIGSPNVRRVARVSGRRGLRRFHSRCDMRSVQELSKPATKATGPSLKPVREHRSPFVACPCRKTSSNLKSESSATHPFWTYLTPALPRNYGADADASESIIPEFLQNIHSRRVSNSERDVVVGVNRRLRPFSRRR